MLPVFLDCPFLIAPSIFSNIYQTESIYPLHALAFNQFVVQHFYAKMKFYVVILLRSKHHRCK